MSFLLGLERRASVGPSIKLSSGDPALDSFWGGGGKSASGQNVNAITALSNSTIFACVDRKAKTLAMLPLEIKRDLPDGGFEIAKNFRLYRQMSVQPNAWQTSFDWRYMGQVHKMLRGNFYNYIQSTPGRGMNQLIPLHPDRVWPFVITPEGVTYYMYDNSPPPPANSKLYYQYFPVNGAMQVFRADEIFHVRGLSDNGIVGKTVVRLMKDTIGLSMAMEEQGSKLFTNGAQISKVFRHPNKLDDPAFDRLKKQLDQYSGVENSHRTIILENGMDISSLSMTMQDSQFLESRKFEVEEMCSCLDVPMMLIHRSGDKNQTFASAEVINQLYLTHSMQPEFVNWEQRLKIDLLYDSEQAYNFKFNFDELMRGDMAAQGAYIKARFATASWTPNDVKAYCGESPDSAPECSKHYLASGMLPADIAGQQNMPVETKPVEVKPKEEVKV